MKTEINAVQERIGSVEVFHFIDRRTLSGFIKSWNNLNQLISEFRPDLIHVHYGSTTGFLGALSKKTCPWVISFGGSELLGHPNKGIYWRAREKWAIGLSHFAANRADSIICVSKNLFDALSIRNQQKTFLIPRGIDLSVFTVKNKLESRKKLGWSENKKYVLFSFPRLNAEVKNKSLAEKVISVLNEKYFLSELIILFNKSQDFINTALNAADALLVTSLHEGSPNIVKEAMASDLPVVSVNCGDVKERLENVSPSFVSQSYNHLELVKGLGDILLKNERSNGLDSLIESGIDLKSTIEKILNVYQMNYNS